MTRLLHTGDTHLGYQQYHVPERRADFLAAFRQVVEDAVAEDVDAVVHAGDLFHDRRPTLSDVMGTIDVLRTLADADVPFLAIVGNHEAKRDAQWLDLFESLGLATRLDDEPIEVGDTAVYGLDFVPRSRRDDLDYDFADHDADHATLVAHGLFEPFDHGEWDAREIIQQSPVAFDALLFGDNHAPGTREVDGTWLTYCGSTERASADEREDRGYNLVTFDGEVTISRRGLDTREFVFVEMDLAEHEGVEDVRTRVSEYDLSDAVVVVHLDGEGDPIAPASIEEYAREEGALVARVTDHREGSDAGDVAVSFADPDDAVRERVRELGLSEAARDIDETVRASKVPDSRVADEVESTVTQLLEADDPSVFEDSSVGEPTDTEESESTAGTNEATVSRDPAREDPTDETLVTETEPDASNVSDGAVEDVAGESAPRSDGSDGEGPAPSDDSSSSAGRPSGDDQASMEDYL